MSKKFYIAGVLILLAAFSLMAQTLHLISTNDSRLDSSIPQMNFTVTVTNTNTTLQESRDLQTWTNVVALDALGEWRIDAETAGAKKYFRTRSP